MASFRGQKKAWATPRLVSFRGLIQNFRRASLPLSYAESPPPLEFYWNCTVVLSQSLGYLWAYPGLIHYILLICENVSLDWSTMEIVGKYGKYGCQNAGFFHCFVLFEKW